jgi:LacI family transcriptional regulator
MPVFVDRKPKLLDADAVVSGNRLGAVSAVKHLLKAGHRRIAFLGDRASIFTATQRFDGYLHELEFAHLRADDAIIQHELVTAQAAP